MKGEEDEEMEEKPLASQRGQEPLKAGGRADRQFCYRRGLIQEGTSLVLL